jgi:predicted GNAT family N-acyltransferase
VTVDEVAAELTYPLRKAVLRPDGGEVVWAGDEDPATFHLAARAPDGRIVGVVRFSPAACPWRPAADPWQLRGMATDATVRGSGAGRALVAAGLKAVAARGGDLLWCDARMAAVGFYERMGFTVVTEPYDKPGIGPHLGMLVPLPFDGSRRDSGSGHS